MTKHKNKQEPLTMQDILNQCCDLNDKITRVNATIEFHNGQEIEVRFGGSDPWSQYETFCEAPGVASAIVTEVFLLTTYGTRVITMIPEEQEQELQVNLMPEPLVTTRDMVQEDVWNILTDLDEDTMNLDQRVEFLTDYIMNIINKGR